MIKFHKTNFLIATQYKKKISSFFTQESEYFFSCQPHEGISQMTCNQTFENKASTYFLVKIVSITLMDLETLINVKDDFLYKTLK
jgi:hypothetical protein